LIVFAVKICKQCLQTASASEGLRPWASLGQSPLDYSPQMKLPGDAIVYRHTETLQVLH